MIDKDKKIINTIRSLSVDAIQKANSGHPGIALGSAPIAYTLWAKHLKHNPKNPKWRNRDRFILSAVALLVIGIIALVKAPTTDAEALDSQG